jgi:hypothetical protein
VLSGEIGAGNPFAVFAKAWDSVLLRTSAIAMMPGRIPCMGKESQNLGRFAVGIPTLAKKTQGCATRPNPYGAHTGSDWDCSTHIDVVGRKFDI